MTRYLKWVTLAAILALVAAACGGADNSSANAPSGGPSQALTKGGTLRIGMNGDVFTGFDPQKEYYQVSFAFYRCCLLRTLLSYNGLDSAHQGNELFPDLAASMPTVSSDGLTWTFHLKKGIHYGDPLGNVEITTPDIVRAILRTATPSVAAGYPFYYEVIQGFKDVEDGKATTISGLSTPDDHTLVVKLDHPAGYLGNMFAMPTTAPIPPNPDDPGAAFGVAQGHDNDYGHFMVSSGPYEWAGSDKLDFSLPVKQQPQVTGYQPNKHWSLVRNPNWTQDDLRKAYVDSIEADISPGVDTSVLDKQVANDELDTVFQNTVTPATVRLFKTDTNLADQLHTNPSPSNYYFGMNPAIKPFDDIHVRKAVQYAIDKAGQLKITGGSISGTVAHHFVPDGLLTTSNGAAVLKDYNPYPSTSDLGADAPDGLKAAKAEMAQSKYDTNQDGVCDAPECSGILAVGANDTTAAASNALVSDNLAKIGIKLDIKEFDGGTAYSKLIDPKNHIAFMLTPGWIQDWPDAMTFFYLTFYGPNIIPTNNANYTMLGATAQQLRSFGFDLTTVPSMNSTIEGCFTKTGDDAVNCWANADKVLMEQMATVVPYVISNSTQVTSSRVQNFTFGAFDGQTAYDQIALAPGSS